MTMGRVMKMSGELHSECERSHLGHEKGILSFKGALMATLNATLVVPLMTPKRCPATLLGGRQNHAIYYMLNVPDNLLEITVPLTGAFTG